MGLIQLAQQQVDWLHYVLELAYFISGIVLAGIGIAALWQLKLAKDSLETAKENLRLAAEALATTREDIQIRITREAIIIAVQQSERFANEILPRASAVLEEIAAPREEVSEFEVTNNLFDETSIPDWNLANVWIRNLNERELTTKVIDTLNSFEAFAMYFAKRAADESVVYQSIGPVFCAYTRCMAPILIHLRRGYTNRPSGPYHNLVTLYSIWSDRAQKESLELEANKLKDKLSGIHITEIPPIGVLPTRGT